MSKRNAGRRGRPRKRRAAPAGTALAEGASGEAAQAASSPRVAPGQLKAPRAAAGRREGRGARDPGAVTPDRSRRDPGGVGERPEAPWHPWPFSELLILVGAIGTIVGFGTGATATLFAGLGAVVLGTLEFTIREHRAGYRSHAALLAAVPTALVHGGVALGLYAAGARGGVLVLAPLLVDVPVFWLLYRMLKARFDDARRERVFALKRR
ncbi:MAG TPA: hypothetical protein VNV44_01640 [Solirubrobacteraceae bacterium]|jgi:hypothetical protein|nr:hypothetical protein [Solirubrobacteraceae bacterium]